MTINRRTFCQSLAAAAAAPAFAAAAAPFKLNYILASALYGTFPLADILPEAGKTNASAVDIWPRPHGNQREQVAEMGEQAFAALLGKTGVSLGAITCYTLGPFKLAEEMALARRLGGRNVVFVCGGSGPKDLTGDALKTAVRQFADKLRPHIAKAAENQALIAIENHGNNLIDSPDSMKWLIEFTQSPNLGIALAPHHLCPHYLALDGIELGKLTAQLGTAGIAFVYAQQHGKGATQTQPKADELLQMPGRGDLDFGPMMRALKAMNYAGYTEIFMHPFPRGVPILETPAAITAEVNRARQYLEALIA